MLFTINGIYFGMNLIQYHEYSISIVDIDGLVI